MTEGREVRVAAIGDIHFDGRAKGSLRGLFSEIGRDAHILAISGDLTTHGDPDQAEGLIAELEGLDIPIVAVLGNHDYEMGQEARLCEILAERDITVLDGTGVEIEGIGFAGVKGFGGGFGRRTLGPFGERIYKDFVQAAIDEALKLETALKMLRAETKVALLHYSPLRDTLVGESEEIFPFLGSSRLLPPLETYGVQAVFHGHAHAGIPEATSSGGVKVYNVARMVLEKATGRSYRIWSAAAPDRRQRET
jgi:Icc-related predicted phosphoesterase